MKHDYSNWCHQPPLWFWPLGDAYYAIWTGKQLGFDDKLSQGMRFAWRLLLEHDAGVRRAEEVEVPVLDGMTEFELEVAKLASLMFGLHRTEVLTGPIPFSVSLVSDRLRVSRGQAGDAIKTLRRAGTIKHVDSTPGQGRPTYLYVPGVY